MPARLFFGACGINFVTWFGNKFQIFDYDKDDAFGRHGRIFWYVPEIFDGTIVRSSRSDVVPVGYICGECDW